MGKLTRQGWNIQAGLVCWKLSVSKNIYCICSNSHPCPCKHSPIIFELINHQIIKHLPWYLKKLTVHTELSMTWKLAWKWPKSSNIESILEIIKSIGTIKGPLKMIYLWGPGHLLEWIWWMKCWCASWRCVMTSHPFSKWDEVQEWHPELD